MIAGKLVGRNAASRKYDLIAALGAHALSADKHRQRLVLRLITLVTARYNWRLEELCVGQREIARLWAVNERTVKRDMATLRNMGWLVVKRQGVRGRVSVMTLDLERLWRDTAPSWPALGPDFEARMAEQAPSAEPPDSNVVPLNLPQGALPDGEGPWPEICRALEAEDPAAYRHWFSRLELDHTDNGILGLTAPNRFIASYVETHLTPHLLRAAYPVLGPIRHVSIAVL
ncbi:DnaA N-terminal domain-containing protein [Halovulum sp. GXIMD14794]